MRVLFTHSYFLKFDEKQLNTAMPYPPLGTLYAMAYLRANGCDVRLFDNMFSRSSHDIESTIDDYQPDIFVSYDDCFNYLTKMCLTNMREACFEMLQYAHSKGCYTITCSSDSSDHPSLYLSKGADVIALGEGEQTLLEVCNAFKNGTSLDEIKGISYLKGSEAIKTPKREVLKDLDSLPVPAWDLIDLLPYKTMWMKHHGYFSLNFVTTRGCPYKCNWCAKPIYGNRYNTHSAEKCVKELYALQKQFGFEHVWFADDIFGLKTSWVIDFSKYSRQYGLKIRYKIQSRADLLVQEQYVEALAVSGCNEVWMGAESGSQKILDAMDKGTTVAQIKEARQLLKQHGIKACFFLQLGYLGETIEDIKLTLDLISETMPDDLGISVSYPLPGTLFYEKVKQDLVHKTNWTDSDELALMFKNTYSADFYKQLHHYIHKLYRQKKAENTIQHVRSLKDLKKLLAYPFYRWATKRSFSQLSKTEPQLMITL